MRKTLALAAAVTVTFAVAASGQSDGRRPKPGEAEEELIALSRQFVAAEIGALVVSDAGVKLTPAGPMSALEVKGRMPGELQAPAVSIAGDEAVVTGRVVFKGRTPEGHATHQESGIRIRYVRAKEGWKLVDGCLGACSPV